MYGSSVVTWISLFISHLSLHKIFIYYGTQFTIGPNADICLNIKDFKEWTWAAFTSCIGTVTLSSATLPRFGGLFMLLIK